MTKQQKLEAIYEAMADKTLSYHPVRIGDVLDYWDFEGTEYALLDKWKNKRLPIDNQSELCIDFVYSLIN